MNKKLKEIFVWIILIVISPIFLFLFTNIGNIVANKNNKNVTENKKEIYQEIPKESKKNSNLPSPDESKKNVENKNEVKNDVNEEVKKQDNGKSEKDKEIQYTIKSGDTLYSISQEYYGNDNIQKGIDLIKKSNELENDNLHAGEIIKIPKLD